MTIKSGGWGGTATRACRSLRCCCPLLGDDGVLHAGTRWTWRSHYPGVSLCCPRERSVTGRRERWHGGHTAAQPSLASRARPFGGLNAASLEPGNAGSAGQRDLPARSQPDRNARRHGPRAALWAEGRPRVCLLQGRAPAPCACACACACPPAPAPPPRPAPAPPPAACPPAPAPRRPPSKGPVPTPPPGLAKYLPEGEQSKQIRERNVHSAKLLVPTHDSPRGTACRVVVPSERIGHFSLFLRNRNSESQR